MKSIKLMPEYGCYPIWYKQNNNDVYENGYPQEILSDINLITLLNEIEKEFKSLYQDDEKSFEYLGFPSIGSKDEFIDKLNAALNSLKAIYGESCIIEDSIAKIKEHF